MRPARCADPFVIVFRWTSAEAQPSNVRITASGTSASATAARPNSAGGISRARVTAAAKANTSRCAAAQRHPAQPLHRRLPKEHRRPTRTRRRGRQRPQGLIDLCHRPSRLMSFGCISRSMNGLARDVLAACARKRKHIVRAHVDSVMAIRADIADVADSGEMRLPQRDLVLMLSFTSWSGALARGLCMPEDRLAAALVDSARVRRLLVVNPFRSAPVALARRLARGESPSIPGGPTRHLLEPLRLRRFDPTGRAGIRACVRAVRAQRLPGGCPARPGDAARDHHPSAARRLRPLRLGVGCDVLCLGRLAGVRSAPPLVARIRRGIRSDPVRGASRGRSVGPTARPDRPHRPLQVLANGVDADEWLRPGEAPSWFAALPGPRLLYVGTLDDRIDVALVRDLAANLDAGSIVLVGPVRDSSHVRTLEQIERVHVAPPVGRPELPGLVAAADVGLIPHVRTPMTESMSPLKLYEYLAGGLPVASVDLPAVHGVSPRVVIASPMRAFSSAVAHALRLGRASERERLQFVAQHSWEERFRRLLDVVLGDQPERSRSTRNSLDA